jgi:hypothetical protein
MKTGKVEHVRLLDLNEITPSPENAQLYKPVTPDDEATIELAESIREHGILDPLVVSADGYVISGHRRLCAGRMAGLEKIPCRVDEVPAWPRREGERRISRAAAGAQSATDKDPGRSSAGGSRHRRSEEGAQGVDCLQEAQSRSARGDDGDS